MCRQKIVKITAIKNGLAGAILSVNGENGKKSQSALHNTKVEYFALRLNVIQ